MFENFKNFIMNIAADDVDFIKNFFANAFDYAYIIDNRYVYGIKKDDGIFIVDIVNNKVVFVRVEFLYYDSEMLNIFNSFNELRLDYKFNHDWLFNDFAVKLNSLADSIDVSGSEFLSYVFSKKPDIEASLNTIGKVVPTNKNEWTELDENIVISIFLDSVADNIDLLPIYNYDNFSDLYAKYYENFDVYEGNINKFENSLRVYQNSAIQTFSKYYTVYAVDGIAADSISTEKYKNNIIGQILRNFDVLKNLDSELYDSSYNLIYKKLYELIFPYSSLYGNQIKSKINTTIKIPIESPIFINNKIYETQNVVVNITEDDLITRFTFENINGDKKIFNINYNDVEINQLGSVAYDKFYAIDKTTVLNDFNITYSIYNDSNIDLTSAQPFNGYIDFIIDLNEFDLHNYIPDWTNIEIYGCSINITTPEDISEIISRADREINAYVNENKIFLTNTPIFKIGNKYFYTVITSDDYNSNKVLLYKNLQNINSILSEIKYFDSIVRSSQDYGYYLPFIKEYLNVQSEDLRNDVYMYFVVKFNDTNTYAFVKVNLNNNKIFNSLNKPQFPSITQKTRNFYKNFYFSDFDEYQTQTVSNIYYINKPSDLNNFTIKEIYITPTFSEQNKNLISQIGRIEFIGKDLSTNISNIYTIDFTNLEFVNIYDYIPENVVVEDSLTLTIDFKFLQPTFSEYNWITISAKTNIDTYEISTNLGIGLYRQIINTDKRYINIGNTNIELQYGHSAILNPSLKVGRIQTSNYFEKYPDNIKVLLAKNIFEFSKYELNIDAVIPSDLTNLITDFDVLDLFNFDIGNEEYILPLGVNDYNNTYVKIYAKFYLNNDSTDTVDINYYNSFNIDYTAMNNSEYVLVADGKLSDYTGQIFDEIFKIYKLNVELYGKKPIVSTTRIPIYVELYLEKYSDYTSYINNVDATTFIWNDIIYIDYISASDVLRKDTYFTPNILNVIEYDDVYGINPKDYIYNLNINLYTINSEIAKPSELFIDILETTPDVEFAIPYDYSNVEYIEFEEPTNFAQISDYNIVSDAINQYIRKKCPNCDIVDLKLKIRLKPKYYGYNVAGIVIGDYIHNTKFEFFIPYIFYKKALGTIVSLNKSYEIEYSKNIETISNSITQTQFEEIKKVVINILEKLQYSQTIIDAINNTTNLVDLYNTVKIYLDEIFANIILNSLETGIPNKSIAKYYVFNSSIENKVLTFKFKRNSSGKIVHFTDYTVELNPLEFNTIEIEESLDLADYTSSQSGFVYIDVYSDGIYIDTIYLQIPSIDLFMNTIRKLIDKLAKINIKPEEEKDIEKFAPIFKYKPEIKMLYGVEYVSTQNNIIPTDLTALYETDIILNIDMRQKVLVTPTIDNKLKDILSTSKSVNYLETFYITSKEISKFEIESFGILFEDCTSVFSTLQIHGNSTFIPVITTIEKDDAALTYVISIKTYLRIKVHEVSNFYNGKINFNIKYGSYKDKIQYFENIITNITQTINKNTIVMCNADFNKQAGSNLTDRPSKKNVLLTTHAEQIIEKDFNIENLNVYANVSDLPDEVISQLKNNGLIYTDELYTNLYFQRIKTIKEYIKECNGDYDCIFMKVHNLMIRKPLLLTFNLKTTDSGFYKTTLQYNNMPTKFYYLNNFFITKENSVKFISYNNTIRHILNDINFKNILMKFDETYITNIIEITDSIIFYKNNYNEYVKRLYTPINIALTSDKATVVQKSEYSKIYETEIVISKALIGYVNIKRIKVFSSIKDIDIVLSSPFEDVFLGKGTLDAYYDINLDKYYLADDLIYKLELYGIPNKTGAYKTLIFVEYEFSGKIYTIVKEVNIDIVLPNALDFEQLEVKAYVLDAANASAQNETSENKSEVNTSSLFGILGNLMNLNNNCGQDIDVRGQYTLGGKGFNKSPDEFNDELLNKIIFGGTDEL